MSVKPSGFLHTSTTTPGKRLTISWQHGVINKRVNINNISGYGVSLPGKPSQLARHRNELLRNGIPEHQQVMVDWTYSIFQGLLKEAQRIGYQGKIVCGDLTEVVRSMWAEGKQIDVIDFDDIRLLKDYHIDLITDAILENVKVFILVLTTRGNKSGMGECLEYWQRICNIQARWVNYKNKYVNPIGKITENAVKETIAGHGYSLNTRRYQGRGNCPMISLLITKD